MNLQNLSIIFIIIAIPIMIVTSYYIGLQSDTLKMQTSYNAKLVSSANDAINSYEINTVEWNEEVPSTAEAKREYVMAAINTFTSSFADNIGMSGVTKDTLLPYIPAIAFTTYDGFYIYSPTETKAIIKNENNVAVRMTEKIGKDTEIIGDYNFNKEDVGKLLYECSKDESNDGKYFYKDANGVAKEKRFTFNVENAKEVENGYVHMLKPFIPYAAEYNNGDIDVVINYSLDNYIKVYGTINGDYITKSGYLESEKKIEELRSNLAAENNLEENNLEENYLEEKVAWRGDGQSNYTVNEYRYVYSEGKTKVYFDNNTAFTVDANNIRYDLENRTDVTYKKIATGIDSNKEVTYVYQALCKGEGREQGKCYDKNGNEYTEGSFDLQLDYSAINYYYETKAFNEWINTINTIKTENIQFANGVNSSEINRTLGEIFSGDYSETSVFNQHKLEVIKQSIINNLNQAITSYSRNNENGNIYRLPMLKETDWDQVFRNVSLIAFVQDIPIGMKYYNNYVIATSSKNKDFIDPDGIYISKSGDQYYHKLYCDNIDGSDNMIGYRNTDYVKKSYYPDENNKDDPEDYYKHQNLANQACYYCLVQPNLFSSEHLSEGQKNEYKLAYEKALARERYASHEYK